MADDCDSMIGCGNYDADKAWARNVKLIDRMLARNGLKRYFDEEDNHV